ncbi:hypothetical protein D3C86_1961610 [compost metagenome]
MTASGSHAADAPGTVLASCRAKASALSNWRSVSRSWIRIAMDSAEEGSPPRIALADSIRWFRHWRAKAPLYSPKNCAWPPLADRASPSMDAQDAAEP